MERKSPLYDLLSQIVDATTKGFPLLAIAGAVALPDICASLEDKNGQTGKDRYKEWCRQNLQGLGEITPDDMYHMRCGTLHNGRLDLRDDDKRIVFSVDPRGNYFNITSGGTHIYSVNAFCSFITDRVFLWHEANRMNPVIQRNMKNLMQYYMQGVPPAVMGVPVIA